MTKVKLILGGVAGAAGLTGAALMPSLMNSGKKIDSGGKAVAKSWAEGTDKSTSFRSFGSAFAPFLVDVDKTDDAFWTERVEATKGVSFDSGKTFSGWESIADVGQRISKIKEGCRSFQSSELKNPDMGDIEKIMSLCGIYDSTEEKPKFSEDNRSGLSELETWTVERVCKLLVNNNTTIKNKCSGIGVTPSAK